MKALLAIKSKDPDAKLDYQIDWAAWLAGDTIQSVAWTIPAGITSPTTSNTTTTTTIWLQGGTAGSYYEVSCKITTAAGRIEERSFGVEVQQQ